MLQEEGDMIWSEEGLGDEEGHISCVEAVLEVESSSRLNMNSPLY